MDVTYPTTILSYDGNNKVYQYKPAVSYLMSIVTNVDQNTIEKIKIYKRHPLRYLPWYKATSGGGAITLANGRGGSITYTENFFSQDKESYGSKAYGNNLSVWLNMSAHEIGHIEHGQRYANLIIYLIMFIIQYSKYGHDAAPLEIEAEQGRRNLNNFDRHIITNYNTNLVELLSGEFSEDQKVEMIKKMWENYSIT